MVIRYAIVDWVRRNLQSSSNSLPVSQYHVFLSYSRRDAEVMRRLRSDLSADALLIWDDQLLEPGTASWKDSIETAIECSNCVVVLLSPDAKKSEWVERELDYARSQGKSIIPVIVRGDESDAVPFELISVQRADLRRDYDLGLQDLREALCQKLRLPGLCAAVERYRLQATQADARRRYEESLLPKQDAAPSAAASSPRLRFWNPLAYPRFLLDLFFNPLRLNRYAQGSVRAVGVWIVSGLVWLPVLLGFAAAGRTAVEVDIAALNVRTTVTTLHIGLAFLITALLGMINFDVGTGLRAFLRGPMGLLGALLGISAAGLLWLALENQLPFGANGTIQPRTLVMLAGAALAALAALAIGSAVVRGLANQVAGWAAVLLAVLTAHAAAEPIRPLAENILPAATLREFGDAGISSGVPGVCGLLLIYGLLALMSVSMFRRGVERNQVSSVTSLFAVVLIVSIALMLSAAQM